ncbi:MAG: thioredoxin domain-containing protein [Candidatus Pacebacteria bacterium]|nr:thioredoxin domain-containing protein [Candidatus Paceibacterota bacterium]
MTLFNNAERGNFAIPIAIVAAGVLIAIALFFALGSGGGTAPAGGDNAAADAQPTVPIAGVQSDDHIKGSPDAKVVIVEYSDTECPFCKNHHETLQRIVDEYADEDVAWVYRHFPLAQLHSKAPREAEATECAAELGGNEGFWKYIDRLFEITPSNDGLDLALLPEIAKFAGLDVAAFNTCLDSGAMADRVQADFEEAAAAGARGTPTTSFFQVVNNSHLKVANHLK